MKANEFVKEFGLDYAYKFLNYNASIAEDRCVLDFGEYHDLKRLVESHELVESCGGLDKAKLRCYPAKHLTMQSYHALRDAIADVESCQ